MAFNQTSKERKQHPEEQPAVIHTQRTLAGTFRGRTGTVLDLYVDRDFCSWSFYSRNSERFWITKSLVRALDADTS